MAHRRHVSYLLRLWETKSAGKVIWRASLQNPDTGKQRGFANLADLLSFLEEEYSPVDRAKLDSPEDAERE